MNLLKFAWFFYLAVLVSFSILYPLGLALRKLCCNPKIYKLFLLLKTAAMEGVFDSGFEFDNETIGVSFILIGIFFVWISIAGLII